MARANKFWEMIKEQPAILMVVFILAAFVIFNGCERMDKKSAPQTPQATSTANSAKPTTAVTIKPTQAGAIPQTASSDKENEGIISFEMYIPEEKKAAIKTLTRDETIAQIVESVSKISDDMKVKDLIIARVNALEFKVHASELLLIIHAANITDPFAYKNLIKGVAPVLEYPMTDWQMREIVAPVTDANYRHKLYDELVREQMRNK